VLILIISIAVILLLTSIIFAVFVRKIRHSDKKREEALHHIEYNAKMASIGRLAAGVAHEINNPLAIINEKAGLLKDYTERGLSSSHITQLIKIIESITAAVERGAKITRRLLGFARQLDVTLENIELPNLIEDVVGFVEKDAVLNNISIKLSFPENFPNIYSDKGQLQQVFLNLLNNSIQAIQKNGNIQISGEKSMPYLVSVKVKDDGPGIEKNDLDHIFDPFFTTKRDGTGLGLSITHGIVKKLKGEINVKSEKGKGTEFQIILPEKMKEHD
jgi:two-component system NtrC family sensor kinase